MELQGVQQFLQVPSSGIGSSQQIISIPLNLLTQGNQQSISLLTSSGQIIQIPSLQIIQTPQNNDNNQQQQHQGSTILTTNSNSQQSQQQQHILINQNGQLISLPISSLQTGNSTATTSATTATTSNSNIINLPSNINLSSLTNNLGQNTIAQVQTQATVKQQQQQQQQHNNNSTIINSNQEHHDFKLNSNQTRNNNPGTTPIKTLLEEDDNKSEASLDDQGPTIANLPDRKSFLLVC